MDLLRSTSIELSTYYKSGVPAFTISDRQDVLKKSRNNKGQCLALSYRLPNGILCLFLSKNWIAKIQEETILYYEILHHFK